MIQQRVAVADPAFAIFTALRCLVNTKSGNSLAPAYEQMKTIVKDRLRTPRKKKDTTTATASAPAPHTKEAGATATATPPQPSAPRGSPEIRPNEIGSKAANGAEGETVQFYPSA